MVKKFVFIGVIALAAWLLGNSWTVNRVKMNAAYRNGNVELAAARAIRAGDYKKAVELLEERLATNVYLVNFTINSWWQESKHRGRAIKFLGNYDQYVTDLSN